MINVIKGSRYYEMPVKIVHLIGDFSVGTSDRMITESSKAIIRNKMEKVDENINDMSDYISVVYLGDGNLDWTQIYEDCLIHQKSYSNKIQSLMPDVVVCWGYSYSLSNSMVRCYVEGIMGGDVTTDFHVTSYSDDCFGTFKDTFIYNFYGQNQSNASLKSVIDVVNNYDGYSYYLSDLDYQEQNRFNQKCMKKIKRIMIADVVAYVIIGLIGQLWLFLLVSLISLLPAFLYNTKSGRNKFSTHYLKSNKGIAISLFMLFIEAVLFVLSILIFASDVNRIIKVFVLLLYELPSSILYYKSMDKLSFASNVKKMPMTVDGSAGLAFLIGKIVRM